MNRLRSLADDRQWCVTLNHTSAIDPSKIVRTIQYAHPVFTSAGMAAQERVAEIGGAYARALTGYARDGATLRAVVAEVTSTPYGQRHAYVLKAGTADAQVHRAAHLDRRLRVSPFLGMDQHSSWAFDATMNLGRATFRARRLLGGSPRTLALICAHATVLAVRRVPIHPAPQEARSP
jgi:hypothetical protein